MKVGRNEQCPCGSGKKYKRCCLERKRMAQISDLGARDPDGHPIGRPEIDSVYMGGRVRAVGDRLYFRPPEETKQEFFVHILAHALMEAMGKDWKSKQDGLPMVERHPLALWTDAWDDLRRETTLNARDVHEEGVGLYSATATGDALALVTLAYDMYTLRHAMAISPGDPLLKRLGQREQFQGARYEITVAAIWVRAGYRIEWLSDVTRKLPEFIASREGSHVEIAVEAKSRPRAGLLGKSGERPRQESVKADLARLLRDALHKETDGRPFVVFLDMNLPPGRDLSLAEWVPTLHDDVLAWRGQSSAESPDPFSAVVLTNFSWHWHGEAEAEAGECFLVLPRFSAVPLPSTEIDRMWEAVDVYGRVPEL